MGLAMSGTVGMVLSCFQSVTAVGELVSGTQPLQHTANEYTIIVKMNGAKMKRTCYETVNVLKRIETSPCNLNQVIPVDISIGLPAEMSGFSCPSCSGLQPLKKTTLLVRDN